MFKFIKKLISLFKNGFSENNVFYISSGGTTLPEKLTSEDEVKLARQLHEEDEVKKEEAKKELIERNLRLVVYTAQKFDNTGASMEDLISVGTIGLIKAVESFNEEKQIKMATYASRCIENEILMFLRKTTKIKREVSFDDPLNQDGDGNELTLADCLGTPVEEVTQELEGNAEKQILKLVLSNLNEREMTIISLRYGLLSNQTNEMTQKEVADKLGISQSYISRIEKKILFRLKEEMLKLA